MSCSRVSEFISRKLRPRNLDLRQIWTFLFFSEITNLTTITMGSSSKKKKEKKKDFQKPKLKVGKARPRNTNATDTSFSAKSIVFKQQSLTDTGRDQTALFNHNLSLLGSKTDTQRRDALAYLTTVCGTQKAQDLPQPVSVVVAKAQPLMLDWSAQVRQQLLKLLTAFPRDQLGSVDQLLLYIRAGMAHLSNDIRATSLDTLDWLLTSQASAVASCAGGWVKTLRTFQGLLAWHDVAVAGGGTVTHGKWSNTKPATNLGDNKLLVHQLTSLSRFLAAGLARPSLAEERKATSQRAAQTFPLWHTDAHVMSRKTNPFGYLNLFGAPRDVESEIYEDAEERCEVFCELGLDEVFRSGAQETRKEAGEVGRAAALVEKALKLVELG